MQQQPISVRGWLALGRPLPVVTGTAPLKEVNNSVSVLNFLIDVLNEIWNKLIDAKLIGYTVAAFKQKDLNLNLNFNLKLNCFELIIAWLARVWFTKKEHGASLVGSHKKNTKKNRMKILFAAVTEAREAGSGRRLCDLFMVKPSKKDYPDYYKVILEPMDLRTIEHNIRSDKYTTEQAMVEDMKLMFRNARHFNEEGSQVG